MEEHQAIEKTLYRHVYGFRKDGKGKPQRMPIMTVAVHVSDNGTGDPFFGIGITVCSQLDMPNRRIGRLIAGGRAETAKKKVLTPFVSIKGNPSFLIEHREIPFLDELKELGMLIYDSGIVIHHLHEISNLQFMKWSSRKEHIPTRSLDYLLDRREATV